MTITLKVISYRGRLPDENLETSFGREGGTLGRSPDNGSNHLTLSDPEKYISRKHATITFTNGSYHLTDTSKDGTAIINKDIRLRQDTAVLDDGDRLRIGDYELIVQIQDSSNPFGFDIPQKNDGAASEELPLFKKTAVTEPEKELFSDTPEEDRMSWAAESSPLQDPFVLPDLADSSGTDDKIPENFDFSELIADTEINESPPATDHPARNPIPIRHTIAGDSGYIAPSDSSGFDFSTNRDDPQASPVQGPGHAQEFITGEPYPTAPVDRQTRVELCKVFMDGAGLNDSSVLRDESADELMKTVGSILREMIGGLMEILQGRAELKSAFRLTTTVITPAGNNPLKSFKIVDEVVDQLLTNSKPGFLDAHEAIQDAFADIKHHQMALTAGMQAAIIKLVERFDPRHFAKQNEGGVVFHRKAKSWDAYEQFYARIATDALEELFGEAFAQGYEKQIRKLRNKNG